MTGTRAQDVPRLHRDQVGIARADAEAVEGAAHDLMLVMPILRTGDLHQRPEGGERPTGSARATAMRASSPPWLRAKAESRAAPSMVTALRDQPAARWQRLPAALEQPRLGSAAADKDGIGRGRARPARPAPRPSTISSSGTPSAAALRAIAAQRPASRSIATARASPRAGAPVAWHRPQPLDGDRAGSRRRRPTASAPAAAPVRRWSRRAPRAWSAGRHGSNSVIGQAGDRRQQARVAAPAGSRWRAC